MHYSATSETPLARPVNSQEAMGAQRGRPVAHQQGQPPREQVVRETVVVSADYEQIYHHLNPSIRRLIDDVIFDYSNSREAKELIDTRARQQAADYFDSKRARSIIDQRSREQARTLLNSAAAQQLISQRAQSFLLSDRFLGSVELRHGLRPIIHREFQSLIKADDALRQVKERVSTELCSDVRYQAEQSLAAVTSEEKVLRSYQEAWAEATARAMSDFEQKSEQRLTANRLAHDEQLAQLKEQAEIEIARLREQGAQAKNDLQGEISGTKFLSGLALTATIGQAAWWYFRG